MNKLIFNVECLDGNYELKIDWNKETLHFDIVTNIEYLSSKAGDLKPETFNDAFEKVNIHKWNLTYRLADTKIDDPVLWKIFFASESKTNYIEGKEGNWPYNYDELIEALMLIDEKLEMFKANKK